MYIRKYEFVDYDFDTKYTIIMWYKSKWYENWYYRLTNKTKRDRWFKKICNDNEMEIWRDKKEVLNQDPPNYTDIQVEQRRWQ